MEMMMQCNFFLKKDKSTLFFDNDNSNKNYEELYLYGMGFCIIITVVVIRSCTNLRSRKRGKGRSAQYRTVLQAWFHMLQNWTCKKVQVAFSFIFEGKDNI